MKDKLIRSEYLILGCSLAIAVIYLFCKSDGDMLLGLSLLFRYLMPMVSVGLFYMAWATYKNKKSSFQEVLFWSIAAMLTAMVRLDHLDEMLGCFKVFIFAISPILIVEVINVGIRGVVNNWKLLIVIETICVLGIVNFIYIVVLDMTLADEFILPTVFTGGAAVWSWLLNRPGNMKEKKKGQFVIWNMYLVLFVALTILLAAIWDNGYWEGYHICFVLSMLLAGFPMICVGLKRWLQSLRFEIPMLHSVMFFVLYVVVVLLTMWADYGIRTIYMTEEQANIDRMVYYLVAANVIGLSGWSKEADGISGGLYKTVFAFGLNAVILVLSPILKGFSIMWGYLSATEAWAKEARYYNSMVFITETYGIWPLALMVVLLLMVCVVLVGWKKEQWPMKRLACFLAVGYSIRMLVVLVQWWCKVPHIQIPFPFCGTGNLDLSVLVLLIWKNSMRKAVLEEEDEKLIQLFE